MLNLKKKTEKRSNDKNKKIDNKKYNRSNIKLAKSGIAIGAVMLMCLACDMRIKTVKYEIHTGKLFDRPIRIAFLTDLHSCYYGEDQEWLLSKIKQENPDIVLLGGDIVDDRQPDTNAYIALKRLAKKYPCYYVSGNHECWSGELPEIKDKIRSLGIDVLEGERRIVGLNGQNIILGGLDDPYIGRDKYSKQLKAAYNDNDSLYSVLLTHRPERADDYKKLKYDLVLAGHTHGGQWQIPKILNGLYSPHQGLLPKYGYGYYDLDSFKMIVSSGLARETTLAPRIFNRPEIVIVDLI